MLILSWFSQSGAPATGLSPTIKIRDANTGVLIVDELPMVERGDGFYAYDFVAYDQEEDYIILTDSVTLSGSERYQPAASGEYNDALNTIESTVDLVDVKTTLLRKIQTNKLELADGSSNNWILYDDDNTTALLTFSVTDKDGSAIVQPANAPSKRSKGV